MSPGENVSLECYAEGNPAPEIHWEYKSEVNVKETTVGRQKNISITTATSTNSGVYVCVATNEIGSVNRSVTLMMKGIIIDNVQSAYKKFVAFNVAGLQNFFKLIFSLYYRSNQCSLLGAQLAGVGHPSDNWRHPLSYILRQVLEKTWTVQFYL